MDNSFEQLDPFTQKKFARFNKLVAGKATKSKADGSEHVDLRKIGFAHKKKK